MIFSKKSLDLRDFFTKILPDVCHYLKYFLADSRIEDKIKAAKLPEDILNPFKEKASLVLLSTLNAITKDRLKVIVFNEPKKMLTILNYMKELVGKINF